MCLKDFALYSELEKEKNILKYYSLKSSKLGNKEKYDEKKAKWWEQFSTKHKVSSIASFIS